MEIQIKAKDGSNRVLIPVEEGAKGVFSLMNSDYISLPFSSLEKINFRLGDYADLTGILDESMGGKMAKIYEIVDKPQPQYNEDSGTFDYTLKMDAYYWKWKNKILKYTPESTGKEASFSLTASLSVHLDIVIRNLKALGYRYNNTDFIYVIDPTVENKAVSVNYENTNILDALFLLASKEHYNCDCWVTDNEIHFGRNEFGDAVKIEQDVEAQTISYTESQGKYATRIYAFGSTRNLPENYRPTDESMVVNGVVQKRLMMPVDTPYIDAYPGMTTEEAVEDIVVFEDVYPRRIGTMSEVKSGEREIENPDGTKEKTLYYRYKDSGLIFKNEYLLPGQLEIIFQSGNLNGMKFGVKFNPDDKKEPEQLWEIIPNEEYGRKLPDDVLAPGNNDKYILQGFNIQMVSDLYIPEAEQELKERAEKYVKITKNNDGTFPVTLRSDWVYEDKVRRSFSFGQRVNLVSKAYFPEGRQSRIIGWELNLEIPWNNPIYTIGESAAYSRIGELENKVDALTYKGHTYTQGSGSGVYIIRLNDSTPASDSNVFSALRALYTLMRKDQDEITRFMLTMLAGAKFGDNKASIDKEGLLTAMNAIIKGDIKSDNFLAGVLGSGYAMLKRDADGKSYLEVDKIFARVKAIFAVLEIMKVTYTGGNFVFSPAGMQCTKVEEHDSFYRCYFTADDGEKAVENTFEVDDFVQLREFNVKPGVYENVSNRYFWRRCVAIGADYIDLSKADRDLSSNDIPVAGDSLVTIGNKTKASRQNVIIISVYGEGSPSIIQYAGINTYSLDGKEVTVISPDGNKFTGDFLMTSGKKVSEELNRIETELGKIEQKSVLAQYSSNKVDWHSSFIDGDVWMRTSSDNGKTWGDAIRIVGIKGEDGTSVNIQGEKPSVEDLPMIGNQKGDGYIVQGDLYVWNGSSWTNAGKIQGPPGNDGKDGKYTVVEFARNTSLTEAPTSGWSSTPPASQPGYYIWMRMGVVTPPSTTPIWGSAVRQTGEAGTDGQNVYRLDLSNEVDGVPCNSSGTPTGALPSTDIYVYNGESLDSGWSFKATYDGCNGTIANSRLTITSITNDRATASITATKSGKPTLNTVMTIYKVKAGADGTDGTDGTNAVIYSIKPSATSVIKSSTGALTPTSVTCTKYKTVGNGPATVTSEKVLKYQRLGVDLGELTYTGAVQITTETKSVVFTLYDGSIMIDRENVPVLSDASDLVIGNRNYLKNSAFNDKRGKTYYWQANNVVISSDSSNQRISGVNSLKIVQSTASDADLVNTRFYQNAKQLNPASLSFWVKADRNVNIKVRIGGSQTYTKTISATTSWQRVIIESAKPSSDAIVFGALGSCTWWISEPMLVQATKVSDWTPAPEDTDIEFENVYSEFSKTDEKISLAVIGINVGGRNIARETSSEWCPALTLTNGTNQCLGGFSNKIYLDTLKVGDEVVISFDYKWSNFVYGSGATINFQGSGNVTQWDDGRPTTLSFKDQITGANGEKHISYVQKITADDLENQYWSVNIRHDYIKGSVTVRNFKAEKGNKATTWSPAPEDTDNKFTTLSSKIDLEVGKIGLKVNQVIGGENLVDNSSFSSDLTGWTLQGAGSGMTAQIVNKDKGVSWLLGYPCLELWHDGTNKGIWRSIIDKDRMQIGDTFTVSFDLLKRNKAPYQMYVGVENSGTDATLIDITNHPLNVWQRVKITQTVINNGANKAIIIYGSGGTAGAMYIKNIKVEKGSIASSWTPAPSEQNTKLLATGIDIFNKKMIFTADNTVIQDNTGKQIAMFTTKNGKPLLKAENIDADNLTVKNLDGNEGRIGAWSIIDDGTLQCKSGNVTITIYPGDDFIKFLAGSRDLFNLRIINGEPQIVINNASTGCTINANGIYPRSGAKWGYGYEFQYTSGSKTYNVGIDSSGYLKLLDY